MNARYLLDTSIVSSPISKAPNPQIVKRLESVGHESAIAAPVWGASGELAAVVALQGPTSRFDEAAMRAALPQLLASARKISLALGWHAS